ncbi:MAG: efflux RND transporter periplasmic adaptor subunit [Phycisphaerales bacterium]|nr:efflux RND transporter periplasmic adaptor subunit [Phycisphaerales bacterium]
MIRFIAGAALLLVALGIVAALKATRPVPEQTDLAESTAAVRVVEVQPVPVDRWWKGYGTARAMRSSDIAAEVGGVIVERPATIEPGVRVAQGDLLCRIDPRDYEERLAGVSESIASIEAQLEGLDVEEESLNTSIGLAERSVSLLRSELGEIREAQSRGGATSVEVERLERQLAAAERDEQAVRERLQLLPSRRARLRAELSGLKADHRRAETDLARTRITAPFNGGVQAIEVETGEYVMPGSRVARVVDLTRMEIPVGVPVSAGDEVAVGDLVELAAGNGATTWSGHVVRVAPEADPQLRTLDVFVEVEQNPGGDEGFLLRPGQFVTARIFTVTDEPALAVPRVALLNDRVMVVNAAGRAESRPVQVSHYVDRAYPMLDPIETQWAVISAGLKEGDRVIATNSASIDHGTLIRVLDATNSPLSGSTAPGGGP